MPDVGKLVEQRILQEMLRWMYSQTQELCKNADAWNLFDCHMLCMLGKR